VQPRRPSPSPSPSEPGSSWTEAKATAILDAFRSFVGNAAKKHGVAALEVAALVRDHLLAPDPDV
jgi:hypothetical protein